MNVLLASHNYYPYKYGGTEVYVLNLAKFLLKLGYHITIIASVDEKAFTENELIFEDDNLKVCTYWYNEIQVFGVEYKSLTTAQIYSRFSDAHQTSWQKFMLQNEVLNKTTILHVNGFTPTIGLDLIYCLKTLNKNLKIVSSYHTAISCAKETLLYANTLKEQRVNIDHVADMFSYRLNVPYFFGKILSWFSPSVYLRFLPSIFNLKSLTRMIIKSFDNLNQVTDEWWIYSEGIKKHLIGIGIESDKIILERHGIADFFLGNKRKNVKPYKFLFSSRIIKTKGFFTLLNAWLKLPQSDDKELWITGRPVSEDRAIQDLILLVTRRKDIIWLGELNQKEIAEVYLEVDTVIIPSEWYEIGPLVFHEAIASGCRVISSDIGGCNELAHYYSDRSSTFITGDSNDLKNKILQEVEKNVNLLPEKKVLNFEEHFENVIRKSRIYQQ